MNKSKLVLHLYANPPLPAHPPIHAHTHSFLARTLLHNYSKENLTPPTISLVTTSDAWDVFHCWLLDVMFYWWHRSWKYVLFQRLFFSPVSVIKMNLLSSPYCRHKLDTRQFQVSLKGLRFHSRGCKVGFWKGLPKTNLVMYSFKASSNTCLNIWLNDVELLYFRSVLSLSAPYLETVLHCR